MVSMRKEFFLEETIQKALVNKYTLLIYVYMDWLLGFEDMLCQSSCGTSLLCWMPSQQGLVLVSAAQALCNLLQVLSLLSLENWICPSTLRYFYLIWLLCCYLVDSLAFRNAMESEQERNGHVGLQINLNGYKFEKLHLFLFF